MSTAMPKGYAINNQLPYIEPTKCYWYKGHAIGVRRILGGFYAVCFETSEGKLIRVSSPRLPVIVCRESLQRKLNNWAVERGCREVM